MELPKTDDVHRLYAPRKLGGYGLLTVEEEMYQETLNLSKYYSKSWLQKFTLAVSLSLMKPQMITGVAVKTLKCGQTNHYMDNSFMKHWTLLI